MEWDVVCWDQVGSNRIESDDSPKEPLAILGNDFASLDVERRRGDAPGEGRDTCALESGVTLQVRVLAPVQ